MKHTALLVAFLLCPVLSSAQADRDIVRVNGTLIRQSEVLDRLWKRYGPATLQEMIDELLLRQAAANQKIEAKPQEIDKRVQNIRSQFPDATTFEKQLEQSGTSLGALKADLGEQIVREKTIIKRFSIKVTEDEVQKAFKSNKDKLATPPRVHLRHMLVKTDADAKEMLKKLKDGTNFKDLARQHSLAPTGKINGGDYGFVARGMLPKDIDDVAFAMKPGEVKTVKGPKGVHILQTVEVRAGGPADYAQVKDDLREMLLVEKIKTTMPDYLQELREKADIQPQGKQP